MPDAHNTLAGRLVVITGASSGIGEALARRLSTDGAHIVAVARREEPLKILAAEIRGSYVVADLSTAEGCRAAVDTITREHGAPDILINNAGAGRFLSIEDTTPEDARAHMALPYFAAFDMTRGFIEPMMARGSGTIYHINSPVAQIPWPGAVTYAAARYAIRGFTEALRQDLHGTGIHVGSLTPTRVHSSYFDANPGSVERVPKAEIVVGTMTPEQVANEVALALVHRPGKDTFVPWRWGLIQPLARAIPGPFLWLYRLTGYKR